MPLIPVGSTTASRQALIDANAPGTSFCLEAGLHTANGPNVPKSGNTFIGQFGAIIDGTGWSSSTVEHAVFYAHNAAVVDVTIRNLTLQNLPQRAIHSHPWNTCTGWVIENCEIAHCQDGIQVGNNWIIRRNRIHDCHRTGHPSGETGFALAAFGNHPTVLDNVLVEDNELYDFGAHQKLGDATNCVWRRNHIHDSTGAGIWNDGVGNGFIAEDNVVEDCNVGIFWEGSIGGVIRRNTIRRSGDQGIFVSTSRDSEFYENILEDNFRSIAYFLNCGSVTFGYAWAPDLRNNSAHHNTIRVPATPGVFANYFSYDGASCIGSGYDLTPYFNNDKNNDFDFNEYIVPDLNGFYWLWGAGLLDWSAWQALPQDPNGSISL